MTSEGTMTVVDEGRRVEIAKKDWVKVVAAEIEYQAVGEISHTFGLRLLEIKDKRRDLLNLFNNDAIDLLMTDPGVFGGVER